MLLHRIGSTVRIVFWGFGYQAPAKMRETRLQVLQLEVEVVDFVLEIQEFLNNWTN